MPRHPHSTASNASFVLETSPTELQNLSPRDIDIIDAVIERAGPSSTTFFTVFKAYSEVLKERGLDPQEVVYYGKLLKLGTLRGKNWGEKWEAVKLQMAPKRPLSPSDTSQTESEAISTRRSRLANTASQPRRISLDKTCRMPDENRKKFTPSAERLSDRAEGHQKLDIFNSKEDFLSSTLILKSKPRPLTSTTASDEGELPSPVPPSYKSTILEPTLPLPIAHRGRVTQTDALFAGKKIITAPKERVKPVVDLDEAWKNIKMEQDEKFADEYRDNVLLSRCWDTWKQGYVWVMNTNQQVQEARNMLLLRLHLQKWHDRLNARRNTENTLIAHFTKRLWKQVFNIWKNKLRHKRQAAWREDMRRKMKVIKCKCDIRIKKDAWMTWQRILLLRRAHRHYEIGLLHHCLRHWKTKSNRFILLQQDADTFNKQTEFRLTYRYWEHWKRTTVLQRKSLEVARMVDARIMAVTLVRWTRRMGEIQVADMFYDRHLLKRTISRWKAAQGSKRTLDYRANRYIRRNDELLFRAVIRIWRSRMRGAKLLRFKEVTVLQDAWQKWRYRLSKEGAQLAVANSFLDRCSSRFVAAALRRWKEILATHQNAASYATSYDEAHVQARTLNAWRMQLHNNLQARKVARWAHRYFATRNAWKTWVKAIQERKRQQKLRHFEIARLRNTFQAWKQRTRQVRRLAQNELILRHQIQKRIMHNALTLWTNHVIDMKLRELNVVQQADNALLRAAWFKWKNCRRRHIDEVSLMENYILIRREYLLRRAFYRWLTAKRAAEHRRLTHERKEGHLRQTLIISAWDKWRERFKGERLRPLEYQVIIDHQRYVLRHAFSVWKTQTDSLPAVRFHSKRIKEKFFTIWKGAMPNALKAKRAREVDRRNTLARYLVKWTQTYKTSTTLKAVARARHLGLPTSSRQVPHGLKSRSPFSGTTRYPRRRSLSSEDYDTQAEDANPMLPVRKPALARLSFAQNPRSSETGERCSEYASSVITRHPSPVRSIASMPDRQSRGPVPGSSRAPSVADSDRLWDAIRRVGRQPRRSRNI